MIFMPLSKGHMNITLYSATGIEKENKKRSWKNMDVFVYIDTREGEELRTFFTFNVLGYMRDRETKCESSSFGKLQPCELHRFWTA